MPPLEWTCNEGNKAYSRKGGISNGVIDRNTVTNITQLEGKKVEEDRVDAEEVYDESIEQPPFYVMISVYIGLAVFVLYGHLRDLLRKLGIDKTMMEREDSNQGFTPLYNDFEAFYTRNVFQRVSHFWSHPIAGVPGAEIEIWDREFGHFNEQPRLKSTKKKYINIGSYNYLGFAENDGICSKQVIDTIRDIGAGVSTPRAELGTLAIHRELETLVAEFVGKPDAIVFGMGFATNSLNLPCFVNKGCLLISDELNHSSLILGARLSGAKIKVFKHSDMQDLERVLRDAIIQGQPGLNRPWKKVLLLVEGIYSMEGTTCNLPAVVALKKKYKAYLWVDEAHSIGALGKTGRGICEYYGVDPADIDILMGTFSKSFGSAGGYISGSKDIVSYLRQESHAQAYATSMSPPVCRQIIASMSSIMNLDGTGDGQKRIARLADNTRYFRKELKKRGYIIYGVKDSPVVPLLLFSIAKICAFAKEALNMGIAPVIVGFPATQMLGARARFCISASHTRQQLDQVLECLDSMQDYIPMQYSRRKLPTS